MTDGRLQLQTVAFDHPDSVELIAQVQAEYVRRYGGEDTTPLRPSQFAAPGGLFLVGYLDGRAVACGGWRANGPDAELKRMYVVPSARGRGFARQLLAELERTAAVAGCRCVVLETGTKQPEAIALYTSAGYAPVEPFGHYRTAPDARHLGKRLLALADDQR